MNNINRRNLRRQHSTDGRLESALFEEIEEAKPSYRTSQRNKYAKHSPKVVKIELHFVVPPIPKFLLAVIALLCILYGLLSSLAFLEFPEGTTNLPSAQNHRNNDRFSLKRNGRMSSVVSTESKNSNKRSNRNAENMIQKRPSVNFDPLARIPLPKPVRLLRIPKAGSSSFSAFLRYQYNCTSTDYPPGDCTKQNRRVCGVIDGCHNHKPVPDWKNDPRRVAMITFVREPVARYISAYQYKGHHGLGTGKNITMHTILFPEYDNSQTNYLSRNPVGTWDLKHVGGNHRRANQARLHPPLERISNEEWERRLQEAADLIQSPHMQFVGILEYWNDSLRLFCRIFECNEDYLQKSLWTKPERQQTSSKGSVYSDAAMSQVEQSNAIDRRLYQLAQRRFCRDLMEYETDVEFMSSLQTETIEMCHALGSTKSLEMQ